MTERIVIAITGASGAVFGIRALQMLRAGHTVFGRVKPAPGTGIKNAAGLNSSLRGGSSPEAIRSTTSSAYGRRVPACSWSRLT